ncbi:hypothetical protein BHF71_09070 [Vulcanibacillus modesticaldus]|uniref:non-specific serine/threonine protein kinase n=1 Tax=Vulcanibacillus modesticaldus TaxID=337097 RepID=A0A1D2YUR4_9BACI|nr:serine/threonine-protein kinase [Vulcanibacillus modesticaldus]OEF99452.1 hypothetical protein BHF71_09070 [Vulcanibacillus modesticaldus]
MKTAARLQISDIFHNRYRILSILGSGGMGTVYLAEDLRLKGKLWAIKEIIIQKDSYQQFIDEAKILVSLDHPHLPKIVDYYPENKYGYSYLVMDYVNGQTLNSIFKQKGNFLSLEKVIKYLLQICDLFDYLHNQQPVPIIYRDLKPANIMIDEQDNVRLIDFGIARNYKDGKQIDTVQMGTVGFAAPEQFSNHQTDQRSDIFSLGAVIYFLLSNGKHYYSTQKPLDYYRNDLPEEFVRVVKRMLMINPNKRYQNILEVKIELERIMGLLFNDVTEKITFPIKLQENNDFQTKEKKSSQQEIYINIPQKLIMVVNLSSRAGSTFITLNLAKNLSEHKILTSVIEVPFSPYIYDNIGVEQRLIKVPLSDPLNFYSYPHEIFAGNKIERNNQLIDEGILWLITDPKKPLINEENWTYNHMVKLLYSSRKANVTIIDVGKYVEHSSIQPLIDEVDLILLVIDPMPSEILLNKKKLDRFLKAKEEGSPIELVINRWTKGVNQKELLEVLGTTKVVNIPAIDLTYIHRAIYECQIPYSYSEIKTMIEQPMNSLIRRIIPISYLKDFDKKDKKLFFNKLRKR